MILDDVPKENFKRRSRGLKNNKSSNRQEDAPTTQDKMNTSIQATKRSSIQTYGLGGKVGRKEGRKEAAVL
jgi:hypothetical protein